MSKETEIQISPKDIYKKNKVFAKNTITPDGSATGEVADGPRNSKARWVGRQSCQEPNRADQHLAAKHEGWANHMFGEALYQRALVIVRNRCNDSNGGKINKQSKMGGKRIRNPDRRELRRLGDDIDQPMAVVP